MPIFKRVDDIGMKFLQKNFLLLFFKLVN